MLAEVGNCERERVRGVRRLSLVARQKFGQGRFREAGPTANILGLCWAGPRARTTGPARKQNTNREVRRWLLRFLWLLLPTRSGMGRWKQALSRREGKTRRARCCVHGSAMVEVGGAAALAEAQARVCAAARLTSGAACTLDEPKAFGEMPRCEWARVVAS